MSSIKKVSPAIITVLALILSISAAVSAKSKNSKFPNIKIDNFGQMDDRFFRGSRPSEGDYAALAALGVNSSDGGDEREREDQILLQHETHLWEFFDPSFSSRATVAGNGDTRCTGPFAMSATVCPLRATAVTSAPFETRYMIMSLSPRAAA